jgi:hypothetical protein
MSSPIVSIVVVVAGAGGWFGFLFGFIWCFELIWYQNKLGDV